MQLRIQNFPELILIGYASLQYEPRRYTTAWLVLNGISMI